MSRPPLQWWVRAGNRAYGPYASERLPAFVRERRLTPESSVANDLSGPWWPAGRNPSLEELFTAPTAEAGSPHVAEPPGRDTASARVASDPASWPRAALLDMPAPRAAPASRPAAPQPQQQAPASAPAPAPIAPVASVAGAQAFLVFAELLEGRDVRFATVLERLGPVARARPGVWLLRAGADVAAVRNALSQALGEGESLLVVRADPADAAWFNLGGEADRSLRALWLQPTGRSSRS